MKSKGILILVCIILYGSAVMAQDAPGGITVVTEPTGAEVFLEGDITVAGVSPVNFHSNLHGVYKLKVKKDGYETYTERLTIQAGKASSYTVDLKPKTRFKAMARSFLIPGWGQAYSDQKVRGGFFLLLTAAAGASYLIADDEYDYRLGLYNDLKDDYDNAVTYEAKKNLFPDLSKAKEDAYNAETVRRITIGAVIAAWGLNLLDLMFHFPDKRGDYRVNTITFNPDLEQGGGQLVLTHRF